VACWTRKLTYANVASTLALFLALGGGAVWAAAKIHSKDIASRAVKSGKIATHSVNTRILARNSVGTNKIKDGAILPQDLAGGNDPRGKAQWRISTDHQHTDQLRA
jgi:hypothetical protein